MSEKDLNLTNSRSNLAVTLLRERLSQIARKATEGDARGRENFNTLARWFYYAIKKPQLVDSDSSSDSDADSEESIHDDDEYEDLLGNEDDLMSNESSEDEESRSLRKASSAVVETRVSEAIEDMKHSTKLSVAVTGSRGVGKSLLLNTLLEATTRDSYRHENASVSSSQDGEIDSQPPKKSYGANSYEFDSADSSAAAPKDDMDVDWWANEEENAKSAVKPYKRYTSYSFESPVVTSVSDDTVDAESSSERAYRGFRSSRLYGDSERSISSLVRDETSSPQEENEWMSNSSDSQQYRPSKKSKKPGHNNGSITYKNMTGYLFNDTDRDAPRRANRRGGSLGDSRQRERRRQRARDQDVYASSDVGDITKHFVPDAKFLASIDWDKEHNLPGAYVQLLTSELNIDDARSFLLPQGSNGLAGPQLLALRYGEIPELVVCFPTENEIRLALWELHELISGVKRVISDEHLTVVQQRYRRLLNLSEDMAVPLVNVASPHELPLGIELLNLLGKNFRFVGLGKSLEADRIYIREKMKEIVKHYGLHMVRMIVRLPSTLLEGNRELVEVSGTYSQDLRTRRTLESSDLVMITVDRLRGLTADLATLLSESGIVQKLASAPDLHKAIFVELSEKKRVSVPKSEDAVDALIAANDQEFDVFKQQLLQQWKFILQHSLANNTSSSSVAAEGASQQVVSASQSTIEPAMLDRLANRADVIPAKPLLFSDLHLRDLSAPLDEIAASLNMDPDSATLREVLASTAIPSLISTVPNQAISKMSRTLTEMSAAMLQCSPIQLARAHEDQDPGTPQNRKFHVAKRSNALTSGLVARHRALDEQTNTFGLSMAAWKQELGATLKQLEIALNGIASRSIDAMRQQLGMLALGHQSGVRPDAVTFIRESSVRPLVDSAVSLWKSIIESIPESIDGRLELINTMLQECSGLVEARFAVDPSSEQLLRLQEFCKSIQENSLSNMTLFRDTISVSDPLSVIKDSTMRVLQQHVLPEKTDNPSSVTFELRNIVEFPSHAAAAIVAKIVQLFQLAQQHLDTMQRDVMMAVRSVVMATRGSLAAIESPQQLSRFNSYDVMEGVEQTVMSAAVVPASSSQFTLPPSANSASASVTISSNKPWMVISGMHSVVPQSHASLLFDGTRWDRLDPTAKAQARVNFDKQVNSSGLKVFDVAGDASSQFRVLSHQAYGSVETHAIVRMLICSEILNHPRYYERMITHMRGVDLQEYVQIMSLDACRGDHVTLCAFSNLFGADLMLYSPAFQHPVHIQARTRHILANGEHRVFSIALMPDDRYASLVSQTKLNLQSSASIRSDSRKRSDFDSDTDDVSTESSSRSSSRRRKRSDSDDSAPQTISSPASSPAPSKKSKIDPVVLGQTGDSLLQRCVMSIVENIDLFPALEGAVPDELLTKIMTGLAVTRRLNDDTFARILDSAMKSISIEQPCSSLTDASLMAVAKKCGRRLRHLKLTGCVSVTNRGMIAIAEACPDLETISLRGCVAVSNMAAQELARRCRNLSQIDLSGCSQITDVAVQELLLACPNIRTLLLQNCPQLGDLAFSYFPKTIKILDIFECEQITDKAILATARRCPALEVFRASARNVTDAALEEIARNCTKLRNLEVANGDNITEASVSLIFKNCRLLKSISLQSCRSLTDAAFVTLEDTQLLVPPELELINLNFCFKLSDRTLCALAQSCKNLRSLSIAGCDEVTDEGFSTLVSSCKSLKSIDATKCSKISDASIRALALSCVSVQRLCVANCPLISSESVVEVATRCRKLVDVDLSGCDLLTDLGLQHLSSNPKLRQIGLSDCSKLTAVGIGYLAACPRLQRLRLAGCKSLNDATFLSLAKSCGMLVDLDLAHSSGLSSQALQGALAMWPRLTRLNLRGVTLLASDTTNDSMPSEPAMVIIHPSLEELNVSWCKMVDDAAVGILAAGCPHLVSLDIAWCSQITANAIHQLTQHCPNLRTLNLRGCTRVGMLHNLHDNPLVIYR